MATDTATYQTQTPHAGSTVQAHAHMSDTTAFAVVGGLAAVLYIIETVKKPSTAVSTTTTTATGVTVPSSPPIATPGAPVSVTQTGSTTNSVSLTWAPVEGAAEYQIWQYSPRTLLGQTTTNSATITGLQPNTHYEVFIVAINVNGTPGSPSQPLLVITASSTQPASVPSIPGGFTVSSVSGQSITFSWLATTGATFYQITNETTGQTSAPIAATQATISGLTPNTSYSFTLEACNTVGCSAPSTLIQATTSNTSSTTTPTTSQAQPPAAPTSLVDSNVTATSVDLDWSASTGATSYTLINVTDQAVLQSGITGTSITLSSLAPNTSYTLAIQACNSYGCSGASPSVTFTTTAAIPNAPTNVTDQDVTSDSVILSWSASTGATSYTVVNVSDGAPLLQNVSGTSVGVSSLAPNTSYTLAIQACNSYGCSGYSAAVTFTTTSPTTSQSPDKIVNTSTGQAVVTPYHTYQPVSAGQTVSLGSQGFIIHNDNKSGGTYYPNTSDALTAMPTATTTVNGQTRDVYTASNGQQVIVGQGAHPSQYQINQLAALNTNATATQSHSDSATIPVHAPNTTTASSFTFRRLSSGGLQYNNTLYHAVGGNLVSNATGQVVAQFKE